ncbi:MAG: GNAT family N-acetyltransferase [Actinomycetota bacterium]
MIEVDEAGPDDIDELIRLEVGLFEEDGGVYDRFADTSWPLREGRKDFEDLMASPDSIVLVARAVASHTIESIGFLAGYASAGSPVRRPMRAAVLRSLYVAADHRRSGAAQLLTEQFLAWARDQGAAEAQVTHYAANHGAARFYDQIGFTEQSVFRVLPLDGA